MPKSLAGHPGGAVFDSNQVTAAQNDGAVFTAGKGWDLTKRTWKS